jgi:hypothetical protein
VIEALADVMLFRGIQENIRSDSIPEFVAKELGQWLATVGTGTLYVGTGSTHFARAPHPTKRRVQGNASR